MYTEEGLEEWIHSKSMFTEAKEIEDQLDEILILMEN